MSARPCLSELLEANPHGFPRETIAGQCHQKSLTCGNGKNVDDCWSGAFRTGFVVLSGQSTGRFFVWLDWPVAGGYSHRKRELLLLFSTNDQYPCQSGNLRDPVSVIAVSLNRTLARLHGAVRAAQAAGAVRGFTRRSLRDRRCARAGFLYLCVRATGSSWTPRS